MIIINKKKYPTNQLVEIVKGRLQGLKGNLISSEGNVTQVKIGTVTHTIETTDMVIEDIERLYLIVRINESDMQYICMSTGKNETEALDKSPVPSRFRRNVEAIEVSDLYGFDVVLNASTDLSVKEFDEE